MSEGMSAPMAGLYDVFVDWPGRLAREMPGLLQRLESVGARRVLDVACGTGRHVAALLERGYEAWGADVSDRMLAQAAEHLGGPERLHMWRLGAAPPAALRALAPFDALTCLGNAWPALVEPGQAEAAMASLRGLLRPGGLLVLALKALAVRRARRDPWLPLLKRAHEGRPIFFLRFADFDVARGPDGVDVCEFHMAVVRGGAADEPTADVHTARRVRVWSPDDLVALARASGFDAVTLAGTLADPGSPPTGDDVVLTAVAAGT